MPIVNVLLWEGRTVEQKRELAARITQDLVEVAKVPQASVVVTFQDYPKSDWAENGMLASDKIQMVATQKE